MPGSEGNKFVAFHRLKTVDVQSEPLSVCKYCQISITRVRLHMHCAQTTEYMLALAYDIFSRFCRYMQMPGQACSNISQYMHANRLHLCMHGSLKPSAACRTFAILFGPNAQLM